MRLKKCKLFRYMNIPRNIAVMIMVVAVFGTYFMFRERNFAPDYQRLQVHNRSVHKPVQPMRVVQVPGGKPEFPEIEVNKKTDATFAGDDLTTVLLGTNDECGDVNQLDAIIIVHTAADNFWRRQLLRFYTNRTVTAPYRLKMVFLIGQSLNSSIQVEIEKENRLYGDTVVGVFSDTYRNLTLKAVMGYRWLSETCLPTPPDVIKMDDDVVFDVDKFFQFWWPEGRRTKNNTIACNLWEKAPVQRKGKWKVDTNMFAKTRYDFPYCSGYFVAVSGDLVNPIYKTAKNVEYFWIDDVFMYGMVPYNISEPRIIFENVRGHHAWQTDAGVAKCRKDKGHSCPIWVVLTRSKAGFEHEIDRLFVKSSNQILSTTSN